MAAGNYKATVKLNRLSGITRDAVVNDWYFHWANGAADPTAAQFGDVSAALHDFYSQPGPAVGNAVGYYLSEDVDRAVLIPEVNIYKIPAAVGALGSPVFTQTFALAASGGGTPYPDEVAICLSYRSEYAGAVEFAGTTRPRARHRGRVFLGPIEGTAAFVENATTHEVKINQACRDDIVDAAHGALDAMEGTSPLNGTDWTWGQFSQTDWLRRLTTHVWVDNAFDIQRRRGAEATARSSVVIVGV